MNDELKIRSVLARIDALRAEVESLLPKQEPESAPVVVQPPAPEPEPIPQEPSAFDLFLGRVNDWIYVRGDFAPKGVTREFAVATRWLVRTGSVILVGAIAYFLMLAIDCGWIGPVQRVYGMMFWGVIGSAFGTWLKVRNGRYAILGEVFSALGLVALYLSFGLGHRFFKPPVIGSVAMAFGGLFAATVAAGVLSVWLKSLMIAILALVGGFLVPSIVCIGSVGQLCSYLAMLSVGAAVIAYCRQWTILAFVSFAVAFGLLQQSTYPGSDYAVSVLLLVSLHLGLSFALTMLRARNRTRGANGFCWAFMALALVTWCIAGLEVSATFNHWWHFAVGAVVLSALAWCVRRRGWAAGTGTPVLLTFAVVSANLAIFCGLGVHYQYDWMMPCFCVFAALLAELGVRTRERTLQVLSLVMLALLSLSFLINVCGYCYQCDLPLSQRVRLVWCVPPALGFAAWRLGGKDAWLAVLRLPLAVIAGILALVVVSCESYVFGECHLPSLGLGIVTIVWAVIASTLLAGGIVGRQRVCRLSGLGLLVLSITKLLMLDTASLAMPSRVAVFAAVGVLLIAGAFLYLKFKSRFEEE